MRRTTWPSFSQGVTFRCDASASVDWRVAPEYSRVASAYFFKVQGDAKTLSFSWNKDQAKADYQRYSEVPTYCVPSSHY